MGLKEYIRSGASLKRSTVTIQTDITGSGSVNLGSSYILLNIETDVPCRFRLYDTSASLYDSTETARQFGDTNVASGIALVGDFSMSAAGTYTIDPVLYGVIQTASSYYRVDGVTGPQYPSINLTKYLLEDVNPSVNNRKTINLITGSLTVGQLVSGSISNAEIPRTYLFVSASSTNSNGVVRLRMYSTKSPLQDTAEVNRSFATESYSRSLLIDAILSGSRTTYFSPKIIGANLQNLTDDLSVLKGTSLLGYNEIYYILENLNSTVTPLATTASLHLFSLED